MSSFADSLDRVQSRKRVTRQKHKVDQFLEWMDEDSREDALECLKNPKIPHREMAHALMGMEGKPQGLTVKAGAVGNWRRLNCPDAFPPIPSRS